MPVPLPDSRAVPAGAAGSRPSRRSAAGLRRSVPPARGAAENRRGRGSEAGRVAFMPGLSRARQEAALSAKIPRGREHPRRRAAAGVRRAAAQGGRGRPGAARARRRGQAKKTAPPVKKRVEAGRFLRQFVRAARRATKSSAPRAQGSRQSGRRFTPLPSRPAPSGREGISRCTAPAPGIDRPALLRRNFRAPAGTGGRAPVQREPVRP